MNKKIYLNTILLFSMIMFCSCKDKEGLSKKEEVGLSSFTKIEIVETAPGKFIKIGKSDKTVDDKVSGGFNKLTRSLDTIISGRAWTHLGIQWNEKFVEWKSSDIPLLLREHEDNLYIVGFDRETDRTKPRLRYYKLDDISFIEIKSIQFPKKIAVQNMWISEHWCLVGEEFIDLIQVMIDLNPESLGFSSTMTANIWLCLITGKEYYEIAGYYGLSCEKRQQLLIEYSNKYKPEKLTKIVQTKKKVPKRLPIE